MGCDVHSGITLGVPWVHRTDSHYQRVDSLGTTLVGQYRDRRAEGRPQGPSLSLDVEVGAAAQGEVLVGLGGRGSGVTSVAKPLGKERETKRTGFPGLGSRGPLCQGPWTKQGRDTPRVQRSGGRSQNLRPNSVPLGPGAHAPWWVAGAIGAAKDAIP